MKDFEKAIEFLTEAANFFYRQDGYEYIGRTLFEMLDEIDNIREDQGEL